MGNLNLNFTLPAESAVTLTIWDQSGQSMLVKDLGKQSQGNHDTDLSMASMPDGVYLIRLKASGAQQTLRILLRK